MNSSTYTPLSFRQCLFFPERRQRHTTLHGFRMCMKMSSHFPEDQVSCKLTERFHLSILSRFIYQYLLKSGNESIIFLLALFLVWNFSYWHFFWLQPTLFSFKGTLYTLRLVPTQSHHTGTLAFGYGMAKYLPEILSVAFGI